MEFFSGLFRSLGTKTGILLPTPTLDVQSASVHADNSKFPEESTVQHRTTFTLQDTANAPPQMPLYNPEFTSDMSSLLEKALQNGLNMHILENSLKMVTHQATPCRCPNTPGILIIEQIRHSSKMSQHVTEERCPMLGTNCHTGVFSGTIKSLVHALGAHSSMTESTINSTLDAFIE